MTPRMAARTAWWVGAVGALLTVGGLVLTYLDRATTPPSGINGWNGPDVMQVATDLCVLAVGVVLTWKVPENRLSWLFLIAGVALAVQNSAQAWAVHALIAAPGSLPAGRLAAWLYNLVGGLPFLLLGLLLLLFPTGRVKSRRWRPVLWYWGVGSVVVIAVNALLSTLAWSDPFGSEQTINAPPPALFIVLITAGFVACAVAPIARFIGSSGDERLQMKWFASAAVLVLVTQFLNGGGAFEVATNAAVLLLLAAIGIAILRYRLYEIDIVINKAVVYGSLALFITAVYLAVVVGVGTLVGGRASAFLSAVAAAVVALAFHPVRQRARRLANRLVYGERATPYEVLSRFTERMADTLSLEDVLPRTARTLAEGTGALRADVWLRSGSELRSAGSWPPSQSRDAIELLDDDTLVIPDASFAAPVRHQGELLGAVSIRKAVGDPVSPPEEQLILDVASQAGLVLRNVRLLEDVRASRQRLVTAQDAERRRLERNIHDGAQQQLVALGIKANLARSLVAREPAKTDELLGQLGTEIQEALENLRDLARGIFPPLLADRGLVAALSAQARKSPVPVRIEQDGIDRYPPEVEAAVYFCTLEALQNVSKYAAASLAIVRLAQTDGHLRFEVEDDGAGFDPSATGYGTGLRGIADRLEALGGQVHVRSAVGGGTTVAGSLPLEGADDEAVHPPSRGLT